MELCYRTFNVKYEVVQVIYAQALIVVGSFYDAIERGSVDIVSLFLKLGVGREIQLTNKITFLPSLHRAKSVEIANLLLNHGVSVNIRDNESGTIPLHYASSKGRLDVVEFLIEKGGNIKAKDQEERTPLFMASAKNHSSVANLLIKKGADINTRNHMGNTPLLIAISRDHFDTSQVLMSIRRIKGIFCQDEIYL